MKFAMVYVQKTNENLRWKHLDFWEKFEKKAYQFFEKRRDHLATEGIVYLSMSVDKGNLSI